MRYDTMKYRQQQAKASRGQKMVRHPSWNDRHRKHKHQIQVHILKTHRRTRTYPYETINTYNKGQVGCLCDHGLGKRTTPCLELVEPNAMRKSYNKSTIHLQGRPK